MSVVVSDQPREGSWRIERDGPDSGAQVTALGCALALTAVAIDFLLSERLTLFFDLCFVTACLAASWMVRLDDFYAVTVLPPLLMLGTFIFVTLTAPGMIGHRDDGLAQAVLSGLATHSIALVSGYVVALGCLGFRLRAARRSVADQVGF